MKLWTIQPVEWFEKLQVEKEIFGDKVLANIDKSMIFAYDWISSQMQEKIGPKPFENCIPIWVWRQFRGIKRMKPDLRCKVFFSKGKQFVRLEINKPDGDVLLSDYDLWHYPLNYWCIHDSEKDELDFDNLLKSEAINLIDRNKFTSILKNKVENSWHKALDMNYCQEYSASKKNDKSVQATFWKLSLDEVVKVELFTSK